MTRRQWFLSNLHLIQLRLPGRKIYFDDEDGSWVRIESFPLPQNFRDSTTNLLLITPGFDQPITLPPQFFYVNKNLRLSSGATAGHISDVNAYHGAPNYSHLGYAYFCVFLTDWAPSADVVNGHNYSHVVNTIYKRLSELEAGSL